MGKDKTIAHLKARHPHESTTVAQLEQRINELNLQIKGYKDERTKMDQALGHLTRQRDENKEMVKRKNGQIKSLEELTEQITLERNDLLKNKHDILKEYTQLQRLTCHPIISKETQTITQQERPKKEARQQTTTVLMMWQDIRKYAEKLRKSKGDLRALDRTVHSRSYPIA